MISTEAFPRRSDTTLGITPVSRTILDDTLPGGPRQKTIVYEVRFDRRDREQDYETAWKAFEAGSQDRGTCNRVDRTSYARPFGLMSWMGYLRIMLEIAPRIAIDPEIRFGKPVIKGTRVPVDVLVAKVAGGMQLAEVADEYGVTLADVQAALSYAAKLVADEQIRAV